MTTLADAPGGCLWVSMGSEEAAILFQPESSLRRFMDEHPGVAETFQFLVPKAGEGGLIALLPEGARGFIGRQAGHWLDWELQCRLFDWQGPCAASSFSDCANRNSGHICPAPPAMATTPRHGYC